MEIILTCTQKQLDEIKEKLAENKSVMVHGEGTDDNDCVLEAELKANSILGTEEFLGDYFVTLDATLFIYDEGFENLDNIDYELIE